ncbi:MAG: glycine--tRNA ligase [Oscillospiraceae bacterium]|jgi:glycyl-tRNA synthetase|nr:glycine--tRNA ligase [Oscillospiraceae bacterium]
MKNSDKSMDKIAALCKNRGFIFPGSEIYGGLANSWDYGPLGVEFKNNVKAAWWKRFVQEYPHNVGIDSAILMNSAVWEASGHVVSFHDPLVDCKSCKARHRADELLAGAGVEAAGLTCEAMSEQIALRRPPCPVCGKREYTPAREFNMMFKTYQGASEDSRKELYLRPETAQGIFVQFKNILRSSRHKIPFGVGQIGKSFRNEITPGNFTFRTREFEQMELEFFCKPGTELSWFEYWKEFCHDWLLRLGMRSESLRARHHAPEELSHYSNATVDLEFLFPFGWGELWGIASRTDYDLKAHQEASGEKMEYHDPATNEKYVPFVVEPSLGADRAALAFLVDAYDEEELPPGKDGKPDTRAVLRLHPALAPVKCGVFPLFKQFAPTAKALYVELSSDFSCEYDETGSVGKRYRRQDEIGTPYCITIDHNTEKDRCATIRERDSMTQERVPLSGMLQYLREKIERRNKEVTV